MQSALTARQLDVYRCLGEGMSNAQVSEALGISEHTVRVHISAIVRRLRVKNRTQIAIGTATLMANF